MQDDAQQRPENEDADPVGAPVAQAARKGLSEVGGAPASEGAVPPPKPKALEQEQEDFTSEGAPPPGKVASEEPALPSQAQTQTQTKTQAKAQARPDPEG